MKPRPLKPICHGGFALLRPFAGLVRRGAFTLVEMLVVIAIILVLAGLILSAANAAVRQARINKARVETQQIRSAILRYYGDYSRFPITCADGTTTLANSSEVIRVLQGEELNAAGETCNSAGSANPRKITYMNLNARDVLSIGGKNYYIDSWKQPYNIGFDTSASNDISNLDKFFVGTNGLLGGTNLPMSMNTNSTTNWLAKDSASVLLTLPISVVVYSGGPDLYSGNGNATYMITIGGKSVGGKDDIGTWNQ